MTETWCTKGYGICVESLEFTLERLEKLISRAPEFQGEIQTYFTEEDISSPNVDDYLDYDEDYGGGIAFILQRVIQETENVELAYVDDYNGDWYLILCPAYPWNDLSAEEKCLTEKTVREIIKKYVAILSDTKPEFDYQSVENGG